MQENITPAVRNLLIINVIIFIIKSSAIFSFDFVDEFGLHHFQSPHFKFYQLLTHVFMHANLMHIFSNMFALFMFGPILEHLWGSNKFLTFYFICAFGASFLHSFVNFWEIKQLGDSLALYEASPSPASFELLMQKYSSKLYLMNQDFVNSFLENPQNTNMIEESKKALQAIYEGKRDVPMVGASGAVFGILAAFAIIFPNVELRLLFPPIPVRAKYLIGFYIAFEVYRIIANRPDDNVAHFAHLGGALFAFILLKGGFGGKYKRF
jgi:membrane associated rhomboid family serine protease